MIDKYAANFLLLSKLIKELEQFRSDEGLNAMLRSSEVGLDQQILSIRPVIRQVLQTIPLPSVIDQMRRIDLRLKERHTVEEMSALMIELGNRLEDELRRQWFFHVKPDAVQLYSDVAPFGEEVARAFPSAGYDITEAGKCLALDRTTAAVLHLMRALEIPLKLMAEAVNVPVVKDSWNKILNDIEARVRDKSDSGNRVGFWIGREEERDFYTEATTHFFIIKNAWRNYSTHGVREKYTPEETQDIFRAVRAFFRHLSKRLRETDEK